MSEQPEAPKKIWLEYWPDEHFVYLTDDLVSTGYLTEYVRADYHERLVGALTLVVDQWTDGDGCFGSIEQARTLLAALEAEKGGEL